VNLYIYIIQSALIYDILGIVIARSKGLYRYFDYSDLALVHYEFSCTITKFRV